MKRLQASAIGTQAGLHYFTLFLKEGQRNIMLASLTSMLMNLNEVPLMELL